MTEIAFYHLSTSSLETALPKLLEKTLEIGKRALVVAGSTERVEALAGQLWTHDPGSWLPHGTARDGRPEAQPIWLSTEDMAVNGATFLFLTDGACSDRLDTFERCFDLFDGSDGTAVEAARARWSAVVEAGHAPTYWQQTPNGGWVRAS